MQSKRDGLIPVAEVLSDLGGPVAAIRVARQRNRFTGTPLPRLHHLEINCCPSGIFGIIGADGRHSSSPAAQRDHVPLSGPKA